MKGLTVYVLTPTVSRDRESVYAPRFAKMMYHRGYVGNKTVFRFSSSWLTAVGQEIPPYHLHLSKGSAFINLVAC